MAEVLKNCKRQYLCNALTDLHNIWHGDAFWTSKGYGQLKFLTFENPRWLTPAIWKKFNIRPYLRNGLTDDLHEIWHGGANWHCKAYGQLEFQTSKIKILFLRLSSHSTVFSPSLSSFPVHSHPFSTFPFFYPPLPIPFSPQSSHSVP